VVSGGSTLTMQLARVLLGNRARTGAQKAIETALSLLLEVRYSKSDIVSLYAANAPFGGNVVGLEAARGDISTARR
jgi:penicillin-binding protein 1C